MRFATFVVRLVAPILLVLPSLCAAQAPDAAQPAPQQQTAASDAADQGQAAAVDPSNFVGNQQQVCDAQSVPLAVCHQLALEFNTRGLLQQVNQGATAQTVVLPALDSMITAPVIVTDALRDRAIAMVLGSDLTTALEPSAEAALQQILTGAATTQVGAQPTAGGATNLVTKPTTTDVISIASESGAFTDTSNGTTVTLQANALGLAKLLSNTPIYKRIDYTAADYVQRLNLSAVLNVAQSSTTASATSGSANTGTPSLASVLVPATNNVSFSSFTASYTLYRHYSPQSKEFLDKWVAAVKASDSDLTSLNQAIATDINFFVTKMATNGPTPQVTAARLSFHTDAIKAEQGPGDFEAFVIAYMPLWQAELQAILPDKASAVSLLALDKDLQAFQQATYSILNSARGTLATASYTYTDDGQKPATHNFTGSVGYVFKGNGIKSGLTGAAKAAAQDAAAKSIAAGKRTFATGIQITANGTVSFYDHLPAGASYGRLRDFQASAEIDKPIGGTSDAPKATLSLAGYGQYQFDPTVLNITAGNLAPGTSITLPSDAQVLLGTSGWLGVVQGKVVFNLAKGLSLPVAIKWSNKTDLLQANDVRGQFGLSYDLSALKSLLGVGATK